MNDRRALILTALAAGALPLAVYVATLQPSVPAGDSGELITVAATLGVAHPPGYPLYTMLGHAWIAIAAFGSVAARMNLLSAVCAAGAAVFVALSALRWTRSSAAGLVAAFLFAFSAPVWKYAVVAEVFALNAFMAALLVWLFSVWHTTRRPAAAFGIGSVSALLLSHHHTLVLLALPVVVATLRHARRRALLAALIGAAVGLLPLAYLPWAARHGGPLNWGDPRSLSAFLDVLLRRDYGTFRLDPAQAGHVADKSHVLLYLQSLPRELTWLGVALAVIGAVALARRPRALGAVLGGFLVLQLLFFTRVNFPTQPPIFLGVVERFYILPTVVLALAAGAGAAFLLDRLRGLTRHALAGALIAGAAVWPLVAHFHAADQRGNTLTEDLCRAVLASVPNRGVLFTQGDLFHNGLAYLQYVEGERPDVTVIDQEMLTFAWYPPTVRRRAPDALPARLGTEDRYDGAPQTGNLAWIEHLEGKRPVALLGLKEPSYAAKYEVVPTGLVLWAYAKGPAPGDSSAVHASGGALGPPPGPREQALQALDLFAAMRTDSYFREYDPWSFEADARGRFAEFAARAALHLCRQEAFDVAPADNSGFAKLLSFLDRHDASAGIGSSPAGARPLAPDLEILRAEGYLFALHPIVHDPARARRSLEAFLRLAPKDPREREIRRLLDLALSQGG